MTVLLHRIIEKPVQFLVDLPLEVAGVSRDPYRRLVLGGPNAGKDKLEDLGDSAASKARTLRREASYMAGSAADKGRTATRRTKRRAERAVRDLTDRVRH